VSAIGDSVERNGEGMTENNKATKIDNGGPAFPVHPDLIPSPNGEGLTSITSYTAIYEGMSLRDYFAAKAMQGLLAFPGMVLNATHKTPSIVAPLAYEFADAMVQSSKKKE
jgi:hypothetical protein